jgi:hypothetical protein
MNTCIDDYREFGQTFVPDVFASGAIRVLFLCECAYADGTRKRIAHSMERLFPNLLSSVSTGRSGSFLGVISILLGRQVLGSIQPNTAFTDRLSRKFGMR